jgi:hypothetical protein
MSLLCIFNAHQGSGGHAAGLWLAIAHEINLAL